MIDYYPHNAWYVAAWNCDLGNEKPFAISILGEPIVIYRTASGRLAALQDRCVHRLARLSLGRCEGERLRCMYHGLLFDTEGKVVEIPGQPQIPPNARVRAFPVIERHSWVWVWMGDPAAADESLIPAAVGLDHPDYILGHGQLDYAADGRLINDNLLDFSHLPYVHANSFRPTEDFAQVRPVISALPRGVRFERWVVGKQAANMLGEKPPADAWVSYDFLAPGVLLMWSGGFPVGTAEARGFTRPDYSQAVADVNFTSQAVTPLTARTSRYFFSWGPHCKHGDAALRDVFMGIAIQAFTEDKVMIDAQQQAIDEKPTADIMPTTADKGITIFTQVMRRMVREGKIAGPTAPQTKQPAVEASA
jgi:phenylpropionate dioxygenase-like ring-hydroxylating dioxygenase large terminal subunit